MKNEFLSCKGNIKATIEYKNHIEVIEFKNTVLSLGREALASSLANQIGEDFDFYISRMLFGDGGTTGDVPKQVQVDRDGLFGTVQTSKPVIANIDVNNPSQVIFTSVIPYDDPSNGSVLNEMALQMHNGDLYSMATFPGISKTSQMQITWNWRLSFI